MQQPLDSTIIVDFLRAITSRSRPPMIHHRALPSPRRNRAAALNGIVDTFRLAGIGSALDPADRTCARSRRSLLASRLRAIEIARDEEISRTEGDAESVCRRLLDTEFGDFGWLSVSLHDASTDSFNVVQL